MSGGHFDYDDFKIKQIGEELEIIAETNEKLKEQEIPEDNYSMKAFYSRIPEDIIEDIKFSGKLLKIMGDVVHEIDYYLSGDTGDDSYRERVKKILDKLKDIL